MSEVYWFIAARQGTYPVTLLCRTLGVPRSSFYAWAGVGSLAAAGSAT